MQENPEMRTPRQELHLEIARVERALRDAVDDLRVRLRRTPEDPECAARIARCLALSSQLLGAVDLLGPGEDEDATRAAARGLADVVEDFARSR